MFFILSKVLSFFSSPFLWITTVFIFGILTKDSKKKEKRILFTFFLLFIFSNNFILSVEKASIDTKPIKISKLQQIYDFGVVLGSFAAYDEYGKKNKVSQIIR